MIGYDGYGSATMQQHDDGRLEVIEADDVIGVSVELLAQAAGEGLGWGLWIGDDGLLWLAGNPEFRYRPVRFVSHLGWAAGEGARILVCERVR